jgi:hypothetical protein
LQQFCRVGRRIFLIPGGLQGGRRRLSVEAKTLVTIGSFGEEASFFRVFGRTELDSARNGERGAERGDVLGAFRPGDCARARDFFLNARSWPGGDLSRERRERGALRWRVAAHANCGIWAVFGAFSVGVGVVRMGRGRYTRREWVGCERLNGGN